MLSIKKYILLPLILIGALNWGLVGLLNFDLVIAIFGAGSFLSRVVYIFVGAAALLYIIMQFNRSDD